MDWSNAVRSFKVTVTMATYKTRYQCRECGATSYQPVIERAESGALRPTGAYKCAGCRNVFASLKAWWEPRRHLDLSNNGNTNSGFGNSLSATGR
jgi:DNA-directed RNA polymerase subunit RPC12/RpoP